MLNFYPIVSAGVPRPPQFEAWLDYIAANWMTDEDIVLFSDREAKDMVVQQYALTNPPVTVDEDRLKAIVEFLINIDDPQTTPWQRDENEWEVPFVNVNRPPNFVKISIDEEDEFYSLAESYWHILSALNDLAKGEEEIDYKTLEPTIGPCEPSVCSVTESPFSDEEDSVYRLFVWWQHDSEPFPQFVYEDILAQIPRLFEESQTAPVGPTYPDTSRQKRLRKVKALWNLMDQFGNSVQLNAAELLYIMVKTLYNHYHSATNELIELFPSHVLPISYRKFMENGRFKLVFGEDNQLNWLDLGQRWTMKPAVLNEAYR